MMLLAPTIINAAPAQDDLMQPMHLVQPFGPAHSERAAASPLLLLHARRAHGSIRHAGRVAGADGEQHIAYRGSCRRERVVVHNNARSLFRSSV